MNTYGYQGGSLLGPINLGGPGTSPTTVTGPASSGGLESLLQNNPQLAAILQQISNRSVPARHPQTSAALQSAGGPSIPPVAAQGGGALDNLLLQALQSAGGPSIPPVAAQSGGFFNGGLNTLSVNPEKRHIPNMPQSPPLQATQIPMPQAHQFGGSYPSNVLRGETYLPPPLASSMKGSVSPSPLNTSNIYAQNTRPQSNYMNPSGIY
jgi:hypothetical protein